MSTKGNDNSKDGMDFDFNDANYDGIDVAGIV